MKSLFFLALASTASNVILSDDQFGRHLFQQGSRYSNNFYRRRYSPTSNSVLGVPPDTICSADSDCAGYPLAYCDGVCRCNQGALNAGSTCISSGNAVQPAGSCPPGQTYVTETGSCMTVQMPGEPCQYSQQCAAAETGAFCLRLKCQCIYGMRETGGGCTFIDNQCTKRGSIFISELGECRDVIPPGGRGCSHSLQCTSAYQESTCFLQTCTCPPTHPVAIDGTCGRNCSAGETYSGVTGQCLPTVQPGDQCLYSSQCHSIYPGMICERSRCRCPNGMVFSGSKCSQTCPTGFIINSRGICMPGCRTNQVEFEGECLDQAAPDSPCVVNAQCIGGASCQNGACTCPKAMVAQGNVCKHAESAPLESCAEGQLCTGGSFCSNGNCTCPVGRQIVNAQCVTPQTVDIGGNCLRVGIACGGGSICVAGHCVCPLGMTPSNNVCVQHRTALPGEACGNGEDCIGDSECDLTHRRCECVKETQMIIGKTCQERLRSHPGYPCSNNELCVGGSSCRNGRCSCAENEIEVNKQCVYRQLVAAGEICGNGEECGGGSECNYSLKKCTCKRGYQLLDGKCVYLTVVGPGDSCASNLVRCGGGSYCARGRCECSPATVPVGGKCTKQKQVPPGNVCTSTDTCTGKAVCRNGICQCLSGMVLRSGSCEVRRKVMPSETCQPGDECLGGSKCNGFICECPPGQIGRDGVCRPRQTRRPGQVCHPEDICVGLAYCLDGLCQCKAGERIKDGKCIRGKYIIAGGSCTAFDECQGGSVCIGDICSCPQGKTLIGQQCKEVRRVPPGQPCNQTFVCDFGSVCDEERQMCKCPDGAQNRSGRCLIVADRDRKVPIIVPVNHKRVSIPSPFSPSKTISTTIAPRGTTASNTLSCLHNSDCGRGAICRGGACVCLSNMIMKNGRCILIQPVSNRKRRLLKEPCVTDEQCAVQNSFCLPIGICGCQPGFRVFGSTQCIRRMEPLSAKSFSLPTTTMSTVSSPRSLSQRTSSTTSFTPIPSTTVSSTAPTTTVTIFPVKRTTIEKSVETAESYGSKPTEIVQRYVLPGEECNRQLECIVGSVCIEGICRCPPAFLLVNNMCIRRKTHIVVPPSSSCALGETCGGNSNCQGGICICIDEFTLFRGECRTLPEIHSLIERESFIRLTTVPVRNKFHSLKTTKAPTYSTSSFATITTTVELPTTTPLSTSTIVATTETSTTEAAITTTTEKSSIPSSTAQSAITSVIKETEGTTKAPKTSPPALPYIIDPFMPLPAVSTVLTPRPSSWFKIAKPGHSCDVMTFCTNCSICIDNSCQCPEGLELQGGKCLSPIDARTCIASNHCPSGAECVSGVCRCQPGLALSRFGFCIPLTYVDPGMSCLEGEKCRGGSDCRDGICECPDGMNIRDNRCVPFSRDILSSMNRELNTPCPTTSKSSPKLL